jgi:hypothetical protein
LDGKLPNRKAQLRRELWETCEGIQIRFWSELMFLDPSTFILGIPRDFWLLCCLAELGRKGNDWRSGLFTSMMNVRNDYEESYCGPYIIRSTI